MKAAAALPVLAALVLAGCGSEPPPPPVTITSVESVQDVTLSDGRRIHNTGMGADVAEVRAKAAGTPRERCEARYDTLAAAELLRGWTVVGVREHARWDGATPGYQPAELRVATRERPYGDDLFEAWHSSAITEGRARACPNTERAPLSGREVSNSPDDVYVSVEDGESRFCARRWWC